MSATAAPFEIPALTAGSVPGAGDIVPLGAGRGECGVSYANFMAGMANVAGLPGGALTATASGATAARTISALAANAVSIEDFGAVGDGVTDDSAALLAAVASGQPVRLGAKTYAIAGECDITGTSCSLLGVAGLAVLKRSAQSKTRYGDDGDVDQFSPATFFADGIIFDANARDCRRHVGVWRSSPACTNSLITRCVFQNAMGANNGNGLTFLASDPAMTQHHVHDCEFSANTVHGFYAFALDGLSVTNCRAHDNAVNGIYVNSMDPTFTLKIRALHVMGNTCWNNNCWDSGGQFCCQQCFHAAFSVWKCESGRAGGGDCRQ